MARVKGAMMTRKRRKKTLKLAKGYWGAKSRHFKMAKQAVMKSGNYAYIGRKQRKRDFVFGLLVFRLPARLTAQIIQLS
jgi:large subunit ribosomal protein L20